MTVLEWDFNSTERTVSAVVRWDAAPDLSFSLEVAGDGRVLELRARAAADSSVSSRAIRKLPVGEMGRAVREAVRNQHKADPSGGVAPVPFSVHGRDGFTEAMKLLAADFVDRPQTGAAGRGDERYAMVAALYVAQLGGPKPVEAVGKLMHLSTSTVRNLLFEARERGLLTSIGRGRAGGELTDKARALLGQAERGE